MIESVDAIRVCEKLLGDRPLSMEIPGGRNRKSVRLRLDERSVILTRRRNRARADLEAGVLKELGEKGAPVPRVYAYEDGWLIQEDLGEHRLSQALDTASEPEVARLLKEALMALLECHAAAHATGLESRVFRIGSKPGWLDDLLALIIKMWALIGIPAPVLAVDDLRTVLQPKEWAFVKWDARPGNAIVRMDGTLAWFDWEHCGCRNPLDDVAWLLGDEYLPDLPQVEDTLLERFLPDFSFNLSPQEARRYLRVFGTLHMSVRLAMIFSKKGQGPWWNKQASLAQDKIGVTRETALNLSRRAVRWCKDDLLTEPLLPCFMMLSERLKQSGLKAEGPAKI